MAKRQRNHNRRYGAMSGHYDRLYGSVPCLPADMARIPRKHGDRNRRYVGMLTHRPLWFGALARPVQYGGVRPGSPGHRNQQEHRQ